MSQNQWLGVIVAMVIVALIAGLMGWKFGPKDQSVNNANKAQKTNPQNPADQPIIISDGSLYIHDKNEVSICSWPGYTNAGVIPSTIIPPGTFNNLSVTDSSSTAKTCTSSTPCVCAAPNACQLDISYFYQLSSSGFTPSFHFSSMVGRSNTMTMTSDYDPFDTWPGFSDYQMNHPKTDVMQKIAITVTDSTRNSTKTTAKSGSGKVKIKIIRN